tara:strand:- start:230 stop:538 length:309 start_codon:yes stop_codon:yes gene_type:complete
VEDIKVAYKKPRTRMGTISRSAPIARGSTTPGSTKAKLQEMAIRRANRVASPAEIIVRDLHPDAYTSKPTLQQSRKKKKKKKKQQTEMEALVAKIKKYGIKN